MFRKRMIGVLVVLVVILIGVVFFTFAKSRKSSSIFYTIVTDTTYLTMENDGGSNYNVYYEIKDDTVLKLEDHYVGFQGYEYKRKVLYQKQMSSELKKDVVELLERLFEQDDVRGEDDFKPFVIQNSNLPEKTIYNQVSISSLRTILKRIDES